MKRKNKLRSILLLVFSVLFFVSAYMVYGIISQAHREQDNFERLKETIKQPSAASDPVQPQEPSETERCLLPLRSFERAKPGLLWLDFHRRNRAELPGDAHAKE